jgi:hypothetical protein
MEVAKMGVQDNERNFQDVFRSGVVLAIALSSVAMVSGLMVQGQYAICADDYAYDPLSLCERQWRGGKRLNTCLGAT